MLSRVSRLRAPAVRNGMGPSPCCYLFFRCTHRWCSRSYCTGVTGIGVTVVLVFTGNGVTLVFGVTGIGVTVVLVLPLFAVM